MKTHFGFEEVVEGEKAVRVGRVFSSVASRYDLMNDLMSMGLHRWWKHFSVVLSEIKPGEKILDIAAGTGDLARAYAQKGAEVIASDINSEMLAIGRNRNFDQGFILPMIQCDAEKLPFPDKYFDGVSVSFGLRNMTRIPEALAEMCRVLRPGGRLILLEFSRVWKPLAPVYDWYSFRVLPWLGGKIAKDSASYKYLAESIRRHPDQETMCGLLRTAGFDKVEFHNLSMGVVALHLAERSA